MKMLAPLLLAAFCIASQAQLLQTNDAAQDSSPQTYQIIQRGADHRVWQRTTISTNAAGHVSTRIHSVTELETGMNYWESNQWQAASTLIETTATGSVARHGAHKAAFAGNLNTAAAIDLQMPDGQELRSHLLGLSYYDYASDQSVLIAEIKDAQGQISGNQVLYPNAFANLSADVRYTYTKAGFEQDIILREQPPSPAEWGLNPATTRLQVLTEFLDPPTPSVREVTLDQPVGDSAAPLVDQVLDFGTMAMCNGRAFDVGATNRCTRGVPVGKTWSQIEGRQILIEEVQYPGIQSHLETLPASGQSLQAARSATKKRQLPEPRLARQDQTGMKLARLEPVTPGVVLDYTLSTAATNFIFQGDTTYYIAGQVILDGLTTIEGGAVIKYTNSPYGWLELHGPLSCQTGPYRPAVFTAKDDDSVGESIDGSTGSPNGYYAAPALFCIGMTSAMSVAYTRISYADYGCFFYDYSNHVIANSQFIQCNNPLALPAQAYARNLLISHARYAFTGGSLDAENITLESVDHLHNSTTLTLTNSLLVNVTNLGSFTGAYNATNTGNTTFQTVGAGAYYLADSSTNRDAGTTNISPALLADLKQKTTYPPVFYHDLSFTNDTVWSPTAQRDTDTPDCGYHYEPIDVMVSNVTVWDASLTLTNGVVLSASPVYGCSGCSSLFLYTTLVSQGTPFNPNRIAFCNTVQEGGSASDQSAQLILNSGADQWDDFHQTGFYALGSAPELFAFNGSGTASFRDCAFWSGAARFYTAADTTAVNFTNCFWHRASLLLAEDMFPMTNNVFNNTFIGGYVQFDSDEGGTPVENVQNNLFDQTAIDGGNTYPGACSHNAYVTNYSRASATSDLILPNFTYQSGPLGDYYLPTNSALINAGSLTNAGLAGLYHYTTTTNQVQESNSIVDIGYHYLAVNPASSGATPTAADTDKDGIPDYLEDPNGNGLYDTNEVSDWQDYYNGVLPNLDLANPNNVISIVSNYLVLPLFVSATDSNTMPLFNAPLTFAVSNGTARISIATNGTGLSTNLVLRTDATGLAASWIYLPTNAIVTNTITIIATSGTNKVRIEMAAWISAAATSYFSILAAGEDHTDLLPFTAGVKLDWKNYYDFLHIHKDNGGKAYDYGTNVLWLEIAAATNVTARLVIHNAATNGSYDVFGTTNLTTAATGLNLTNWAWVLRSASGQTNITVTNIWPNLGFYQLASTNDTDGDGLSDAFEHLVSHTQPTNSDSDGDGLPDGWEWRYFGGFSQTASGDYDGDGVTNLLEYHNGTDPNKIVFVLNVPQTHVNTNRVAGSLTINHGVPSQMAVLVNNTNFDSASWQPYASNFVATFSSSNAEYQVWIGLRGLPVDAQQTWQEVLITEDTIPPGLVITNPAPGVVTRSMIQLQGFGTELLGGITFDLTNASGLVTNQPGYTTAQFYDTNLLAYTTNYFQCYDLSLTTGSNLVTVHISDLAGNQKSTNLVFYLDYSGVSNPPALSVQWPQAGAHLAAPTFSLSGQIDDPTATVTAYMVDTNGITNSFPGLVGRTGKLSVPDISLYSVTNHLTLTAQNAAGFTAVTNLTLIRSAITASVDPLSSDQMNQSSVSVSGTLSDTNAALTVNGITALVSGDFTWTADNVPVNPDGAATFQLDVHPDGDPGSPPDSTQITSQFQPAWVRIQNFVFKSFEASVNINQVGRAVHTVSSKTIAWNWNLDGTVRENTISDEGGDTPPVEDTTNPYHHDASDGQAADFGAISTIPDSTRWLTVTAQSQPMLVPPEELLSGEIRLYRIFFRALAVSHPIDNDDADLPVPPENLSYHGQPVVNTGVTNEDGAVWGETLASVPVGAPLDVTPTAANIQPYNDIHYYTSNQPISLKIYLGTNTTDIADKTTTVIVGQKISLRCELSDTNLTITNYQWTIPGFAISNYVADSTSSVVYSNYSTANSNVAFYWVDGGNSRQVLCSITVQGKVIIEKIDFDVVRPLPGFSADVRDAVYADTNAYYSDTRTLKGGTWLHFGTASSLLNEGITFSYSNAIVNPNTAQTYGRYALAQIIEYTRQQYDLGTGTNCVGYQFEDKNGLDGSFPSLGESSEDVNYAGGRWADSPGAILGTAVWLSHTNSFATYLMFQPKPYDTSIFVPCFKVKWRWSGIATNTSGWGLSFGIRSCDQPSATIDFPIWAHAITFLDTSPTLGAATNCFQ